MKARSEEEERRLREGTEYFLGLIEEEKARGVDYAPLERAAGLPPSTIGKIKKEVRETYGRKFTAEHILKLARYFRMDFLEALCLAGYVKRDEIPSRGKAYDSRLNRLLEALRGLSGEELRLAEEPVLAIVRAFCRRGGDADDKMGDTTSGFS